MNVGALCTQEVDLARAEESVRTVAFRMNQRNVGTVVVTDARNRPIGIATDRDLAVRVLANARDPVGTPIGEVMTPNPKCLPVEAQVDTALLAMESGAFRRVVVVDRDGALVGVLSLDDVLVAMAGEFDRIRSLLSRESPTAVA